MKFTGFCITLAALACLAQPAKADPKPWIWSWGVEHFNHLDFRPYPDDPKTPYNSQWDSQNWKAEDWVATTRNHEKMKLIRDFYFADILREQTTRDDLPSITVGPGFYQLGGQDKRRVMQTIDYVYNITPSHDNAIFTIYDWRSHKPIGVYSQYGLYMQ